jgi:hypothetical protein
MRMSVGKKDRMRLKLTNWKTDIKAAAKISSRDIQRKIEREPLNTILLLPSFASMETLILPDSFTVSIYPKNRKNPPQQFPETSFHI